jgi:hypothetical protein
MAEAFDTSALDRKRTTYGQVVLFFVHLTLTLRQPTPASAAFPYAHVGHRA